ncbi:MAG: hypothetical protein O6922_04025 [Chloroflexi bacterium]|nr:hypothetical protein [Chloroflexota bacterium]
MTSETVEATRPTGRAVCPQCESVFKTTQGLAGHLRFRHGNAEWSDAVDRAKAQRVDTLSSFSGLPGLPQSTQLLIARLHRKYTTGKKTNPPTDCVLCGAVCKSPQGLSGHMRYRHGFGSQKHDPRATTELVKYVQAHEMPEVAREAIWEKILRLEGFRW